MESTRWKYRNKYVEIRRYGIRNQENKKLPETAKSTATDLPVIGTKHFALGVDEIEKAKSFVIENNIYENMEIKVGRLGKPYFFIHDPDGILIEIIENG